MKRNPVSCDGGENSEKKGGFSEVKLNARNGPLVEILVRDKKKHIVISSIDSKNLQ